MLAGFTAAPLLGGCEWDSKQASSNNTAATTKPAQPWRPRERLVKRVEIEDWRPERRVPDSVYTRRYSALIPEFKERDDSCEEHGRPDAQCCE